VEARRLFPRQLTILHFHNFTPAFQIPEFFSPRLKLSPAILRPKEEDTMIFLFAFTLAALIVSIILGVWVAVLLILERKKRSADENTFRIFRATAESKAKDLAEQLAKLHRQNERLSKWTAVADADDAAREIRQSAQRALKEAEDKVHATMRDAEHRAAALIDEAKGQAALETKEARARAKELTEEAQNKLAAATQRSMDIIASANAKAEQTAGKAFDAVRNAEEYQRVAEAMKNIIEGYGDWYVVPADSLLDDLAEEYGHKEAGKKLSTARSQTKDMVKNGHAARCDYVESDRHEKAMRFVIDAFNGKVDSVLSRIRHDNAGKLAQEIKDAYTLVNFNGKAFREARITEEYLDARLEELKWAAITQQLKLEEQEEQRKIREQIREEARAQREYEKAIRDAEKEEEILRKAMQKVEAQMAEASAEQRLKYETKLKEMELKLKEAVEQNQRALSMAQQTRRGHVYIISNLGSLGENIYKIGLTRRLEPLERILELGDASVPFAFDVHAIIQSDDAPALECRLHKHFALHQVNKVNHRKEFFRANIADVRSEIESLGIETKWTMLAEAREYKESQAIEEKIKSDPAAREAWLKRQLALETKDFVSHDPDEDGDNTTEVRRAAKPSKDLIPEPAQPLPANQP
jgi:hypothetical protein